MWLTFEGPTVNDLGRRIRPCSDEQKRTVRATVVREMAINKRPPHRHDDLEQPLSEGCNRLDFLGPPIHRFTALC